VPVAVIAVLCLPGTRRLLAFAGGVAAGFLIPVVPFALAAPARFWNSVIVAQLVRTDVRIPFGYRVQQMAGLAVGHPAAAVLAVAGAAAVLLVFGSFAAAWRVTGRRPPPLDVFAAASTLLVIGIFLIPEDPKLRHPGDRLDRRHNPFLVHPRREDDHFVVLGVERAGQPLRRRRARHAERREARVGLDQRERSERGPDLGLGMGGPGHQ